MIRSHALYPAELTARAIAINKYAIWPGFSQPLNENFTIARAESGRDTKGTAPDLKERSNRGSPAHLVLVRNCRHKATLPASLDKCLGASAGRAHREGRFGGGVYTVSRS